MSDPKTVAARKACDEQSGGVTGKSTAKGLVDAALK